MRPYTFKIIPLGVLLLLSGCTPNLAPNRDRTEIYNTLPDNQFRGVLTDGLNGAVAGAVTGFQLGSGTGPGAAVGAGLGAVAGGLKGAVSDQTAVELRAIAVERQRAFARAKAQQVVREQYEKRIVLHPNRDIYPADVFFASSSSELCLQGEAIMDEIRRLSSQRMPWSRLGIMSYVVAKNGESKYAQDLAERRAVVLANELVRLGLEPRRLEARGIVLDQPILLDPHDSRTRYSQAVEFSLLDY
jgi:outer membrane protein OmpA-like peptidoglycan-associated protein